MTCNSKLEHPRKLVRECARLVIDLLKLGKPAYLTLYVLHEAGHQLVRAPAFRAHELVIVVRG